MREIKFRVWDKHESKFFVPTYEAYKGRLYDVSITLSGQVMVRTTEQAADLTQWQDGKWEIMQFIGLTDRNGKEIYESDYVLDSAGSVLCVYWASGKYILLNISSGDIIDCNEYNTSDKEIVGNQYENPREHTAMASDI